MPTKRAGLTSQFTSAARARHTKAAAQIKQFLSWVVESAVSLDYAVIEVAKSERRLGRMNEKLRKELAVGAGASRKISVFYRLLTEMALCRAVDSYLIYLSELLSLIFRARPESLRSSEEVKLEFVLAHRTRARLVRAIIDRKVNQLSYQGMRNLTQFFSKRLGLDLSPNPESLERMVLLVEMRNLFVHARGIVNDTFVQRVPKPPAPLGKQVRLTIAAVSSHVDFLSESVAEVEGRAHDKFGIKLPHRVRASERAGGI
jgi:hypothetical protein